MHVASSFLKIKYMWLIHQQTMNHVMLKSWHILGLYILWVEQLVFYMFLGLVNEENAIA